MVRSYFNGKSGCNEINTVVSNYYVGPDTVINPWVNRYGSLSACNMFSLVDLSVSSTSVVLCSSVTVSGGSNGGVTLIKNLSEKNPEVSVFPNPTESITNLNFKLNSTSKIQISVCNSIGQYLKTILEAELTQGSCTAEINFDNLKFANGLYFVRLTLNGETQSCKVIYNK